MSRRGWRERARIQNKNDRKGGGYGPLCHRGPASVPGGRQIHGGVRPRLGELCEPDRRTPLSPDGGGRAGPGGGHLLGHEPSGGGGGLPLFGAVPLQEISGEGAKVLHNRCVEIGEKFKIPIITKSSFNEEKGTVISSKIEENTVKSIIKKEVSRISIIGNGIIRNFDLIEKIINYIKNKDLELLNLEISETKIAIVFKTIIEDENLKELHRLIF